MQTRLFGRTGLSVSPLGYGAGHIGSPDMSESHAGTLLNTALDLGITLIDTARGYGLSEERIGRHLAHRRSEFVLVSKCGYGIEGIEDWTPACITAGIDAALNAMRTDHIDVMLFHSCPRDVLAREGLVEALVGAVEAGKVRVAGYSGENADLDYALMLDDFGAFETSVNLCDQRGIDWALPRAAEAGAGVIAKRPLANAPWRFAERPEGQYVEPYWERLRAMGLEPGEYDWDELALRFAAYAPGVSSAIVGTASLENLRRNAAIASRGPLPEPVMSALRQRFREHDAGWDGQI